MNFEESPLPAALVVRSKPLGRKHDSVTAITECMTGLPEYASSEIGELTMKTLVAGVAFAIAVAFATQASALPYCPHGMWQHGHYVCATYDQ